MYCFKTCENGREKERSSKQQVCSKLKIYFDKYFVAFPLKPQAHTTYFTVIYLKYLINNWMDYNGSTIHLLRVNVAFHL